MQALPRRLFRCIADCAFRHRRRRRNDPQSFGRWSDRDLVCPRLLDICRLAPPPHRSSVDRIGHACGPDLSLRRCACVRDRPPAGVTRRRVRARAGRPRGGTPRAIARIGREGWSRQQRPCSVTRGGDERRADRPPIESSAKRFTADAPGGPESVRRPAPSRGTT